MYKRVSASVLKHNFEKSEKHPTIPLLRLPKSIYPVKSTSANIVYQVIVNLGTFCEVLQFVLSIYYMVHLPDLFTNRNP